MIFGKNLMIRPMEEKDILIEYSALQKYRKKGDPQLKSLCALKMEYDCSKSTLTDRKFMIELRDGDEIGTVQFFKMDSIHRRSQIDITIWEEPYRNQGYGSEVVQIFTDYLFEQYNMNRIEVKISEENIEALTVFERLGFQREGLLRKYLFYDGEFHDVVLLSKIVQK